MSQPDFYQLQIRHAEQLDHPGQLVDALLQAVASAEIGVFVWELDTNRLIWNDAEFLLHDLEPGTALRASDWLAMLHPDDLGKVAEEVTAAITGVRPYDTVFRVRRRQGGWRYVHGAAWVERDARGKPLRMAGINQDISERYRFNLLVEEVQTDTASVVGLAYLQALAESLCRALPARCVMVAEVFPPARPTHARTLAISLDGQAAEPVATALAGTVFEHILPPTQRKPGSPDTTIASSPIPGLDVRYHHLTPLRGADGVLLGLLAVLDDKSPEDTVLLERMLALFSGRVGAEMDRLHHEAELARLNAELEARVAARTEYVKRTMRELEAFNFAVSHDLNAPLRAVQGFGQILREDYAERLDPTGQDYLERTLLAAERMGRLLDDLVSLSRISLRPLNVGKVDLDHLASEAIRELNEEAPRPALQTEITPHLIIHADAGLMRILIDALLRAIWRMAVPGVPLRIELFERQQAGRREIVLLGLGLEVDTAALTQWFSPADNGQSGIDPPAKGAGLAMAQRVMHRHHGGIAVESRADRGVAFIFWLPPASEMMALVDADGH
ncbi:PAS domain-containing protein [Chitinimonas sp. BJYL2]|uniref:sensor histidine kinase n=1 Tax=Chitinimonas sp. BJYL2 TaxID=2976696 RepID=UPI0022B4C518|nr:PAS domain-containing protein [Chitinimonas sp. BJYL2]